MKKSISLVLAILFALALPAAAMAESPVFVRIADAPTTYTTLTQPYISSGGDTMVSLGFIERLGIRAGWNAQTNTVTLINDKITTATLTSTLVDGARSPHNLNLTVRNGVPYVRLRGVANIYGLPLRWNGPTRTVNLPSVLEAPVASNMRMILATTTSTQDSGLLDFLLPAFEADTGIVAMTVSVGTGAAIRMGTDGEADVMLVHARELELEAMSNGDAISRHELMYNDFIIVGPASDPAGVRAAEGNAIDAIRAIHEADATFISRGDNSGTDVREKSLWAAAEITPNPRTYLEASTGMLATLTIAEQRDAYTVTDRATYLQNLERLNLEILCEGDSLLLNQYSVMVVNPSKNDQINYLAALQFSAWLTSEKGQALINAYGVEDFGDPLFFANYRATY